MPSSATNASDAASVMPRFVVVTAKAQPAESVASPSSSWEVWLDESNELERAA